jgi:DNA-binding NarL/FixJ family response regulator
VRHVHHILIVEDDRAARLALGAIFSRKGRLVRLAITAAEGIEWLEAGYEPCCVILDLDLPDGNGEQILALAWRKGLRFHIVVCTGVDDPGQLAAVRALEPDTLLIKPAESAAIWNGVCAFIDRRD